MSQNVTNDPEERQRKVSWNANGFDLANTILDAFPEPVLPEDFGPYHIEQRLGRGGMGEVFLARDRVAERHVAIKFLLYPWAEPDLRRRFTQEIKALARLEHPFIARLYDVGVHANFTQYFVMEYVDGLPLDEYCRQNKCSVEDRLRLFRSVCEAVQYAHTRLILHRDLKPSNILVKVDGTPKLLDFGIAKKLEEAQFSASHTQTELRFTREFAAPEQIRGEAAGVYTDVYALGVMLYELLAGKPPFDFEKCTPVEAELLIAGDKEPERPSGLARKFPQKSPDGRPPDKAAWSDLDVLCLKPMRKDISRRYSSVLELIQDIDHYLKGEPLKARPDKLGYRARKFLIRNRRNLAAASLAAVLVVGLFVFFTIRLTRARDAAVAEAARTRRIQKFLLNMFGNEDQQAGPSNDLRVLTLLNRSAREADSLKADPDTQAQVDETLGRLYEQLGRLDEADKFLQLALTKTKAALGPDSPETANAVAQLGLLRAEQAQGKEAERLVREGLRIASRRLPPDDPLVLDIQSSLGRVLAQDGSYEESIKTLEPIIRRTPNGEAGMTTLLESLTAIGAAEQGSGRFASSEAHSRRALELDRQVHGYIHPRVANDLANLAAVASSQGHYVDAEREYREADRIVSAYYGQGNPMAVQIRTFLARVLLAEGKEKEAQALLEAALPAQERAYGPDHTYVAMTLDSLGRLEKKRGDWKEAEAHFSRAFAIEKATLGASAIHTLLSAANLAQVLAEEKQYTRAERGLRDVLQGTSARSPLEVLGGGVIQSCLGHVLLKQSRYGEAEKYLAAGYATLRKQPATVPTWLQQTRQDLAAVYDALGEPHKALAVRAER